MHLPLNWRDGSPIGKSGWLNDAIDAIIQPKLSSSGKTQTDGLARAESGDLRAHLSGAVLLRACTHPSGKEQAVHVNAERTAFVRPVDFKSQVFGGGAMLAGALYSEYVEFSGANFQGSARFARAIFLEEARFAGVNFHGIARFGDAIFQGRARFNDANFHGVAQFVRSVFASDARFDSGTFFKSARFDSVHFSGRAQFTFSTFKNDAWVVSGKRVCTFSGPTSFDSSVFESSARISEAHFKHRMSFAKTKFLGVADFTEIALPISESNWRGAFTGALFEALCDLRASGAVEIEGEAPASLETSKRSVAFAETASMVARATFDRGVLLDGISYKDERAAHDRAVEHPARIEDPEDRRAALEALEGGAIRLKKAMESDSNFARAQRFNRLELRARAKYTQKWSERVSSWLYKWTADYGGSIG